MALGESDVVFVLVIDAERLDDHVVLVHHFDHSVFYDELVGGLHQVTWLSNAGFGHIPRQGVGLGAARGQAHEVQAGKEDCNRFHGSVVLYTFNHTY